MYPTITAGDRVTVRFCVDGAQVNVGDIITYSTIVVGYDTGYMFISHRVIEKHREGDTWFFKTKGDNCPEPDWYKVPEYWLFGIVVDVEHIEHSETQTDLSPQIEPSHMEHPMPTVIQDFAKAAITMGILAVSVIIGLIKGQEVS